MAPEVSSSHRSFGVLLGQDGLLSLPLPLELILVNSEPGVGDLLAAAGEAPPPADAHPAAEAAPADRLAPLGPSFVVGFAGSRHTAGELLQG